MTDVLDSLGAKALPRTCIRISGVVSRESGPLVLDLCAVEERSTISSIELFSLQLRGPRTPRLPQQIHRLEHDKLGALDIFLTNLDAGPEGAMYEAVFHRFRKEPS